MLLEGVSIGSILSPFGLSGLLLLGDCTSNNEPEQGRLEQQEV